ncbi:MAG: ABC transporter substrate-binding protein, partial [Chloroflexota bacterium]|nr:ABC transporter substrate-binding protein [Chloroflexota bacterium]
MAGKVGLTASAQGTVPKPTGDQVLRLAGSTQGPHTLDPAMTKDLPTAFLVRQIFRGLMRLGPDLQPAPELAKAVVVSDDGLVYTFTLRNGLSFHDGRPLLADDVVYSLTRALDPRTAGGEAALLGTPAFLSDIDGSAEMLSGEAMTLRGATAPDETTVEIRLTAPRAAFLMKIASSQAGIVDRETVETNPEWWRLPNGSGPFRVDEWIEDEQLTLGRFEGFHAGAPWLERVEVSLGPNASNSFNLYQSGQLDIDGVPYDSVSRALDPSNSLSDEVTVTPSLGVFYAAFRTDAEPLDDPEIRRALFLAYPRDRVASLTFDGAVSTAPGILPHGMLGRDWGVEAEPYDLEAARAAVAASRYG